ncbi:hypothetical protein N657DRAFT_49408 [Parathielavia appendiculata]|uniref:F-box domain-containing protein n=1 Tax=Parathielavia appendiculata TaxID=2587402 RepID=A0AAN6Z8I6_9PEZI|nr:hypothetical protein N657DRAFT_49408 [Parathielavia appendiculata]
MYTNTIFPYSRPRFANSSGPFSEEHRVHCRECIKFKMSDSSFIFSGLPREFWDRITEHLFAKDCGNLAVTSKKMEEICRVRLWDNTRFTPSPRKASRTSCSGSSPIVRQIARRQVTVLCSMSISSRF